MKDHHSLARRVQHHIRITTTNGGDGLTSRRLSKNWIKIGRGTYIDPTFLADLNTWDRVVAVHLARAAHAQKFSEEFLIAGPSALLCHGIDVLSAASLNITLGTPRRKKSRRSTLPGIHHPNLPDINAAHIVHTSMGEERWTTSSHSPFPTLSLFDSTIQTVRSLPEEQGITALLMGSQVLAHSSRHERTPTLKRLANLSAMYKQFAEELPRNSRGRQRLALAADLAKLPVDSLLEARMHWLMHKAKIEGYTTQLPLHTEGYTFFADFAFPKQRIILELDGQAKYGTRREEQLESKLNELARQRLIERQGWSVYRLTWNDLRHPRQITGWVRSLIAS